MTALNFHIAENQILVVADTLVTDASGAPSFFTTKVHPVPHLLGLICGTGDLGLIVDWLAKVLGGMLAKDIAVLNQFTPDCLCELRDERRTQYGEAGTTTIYQFGLDHSKGRLVGYAYRSTNDFRSEGLSDGLSIKPGYDIGDRELTSFPRDFVQICIDQQADQRSLEASQRVFIGGHVAAYCLSLVRDESGGLDVQTTINRPFEFDGASEDYERCLDRLALT